MALVLPSRPVSAAEPWLLDLEAGVGAALSKPQREWFSVGGSLALGVQKPVLPWLAITGRLRTAALLDGDAPAKPGVRDPGIGTLNTASLGVVLRVPTGDVRRATGLWLDAVGGGGFTGDALRPTLEAGVGYGFALSETISLSPFARYLQVFQPNDNLNGRDAVLGLVGVRLSLFDQKPPKPALPPEPPSEPPTPDADGDGIADAVDKCPDAPEDFDEFEDEDGCPDLDNDSDGILDVDDGCPKIAEDFDSFQDDDGCLDDDNDRDGFLDGEDQCPNEPETLNGESDEDGCPDNGLIVMEDYRIVLEERVLFDTDRARINKTAEPILRAIVRLWSQHPEWKKVRIEGHADARGDAKFNQELSERRAANVRDILIRFGMKPGVVVAEGYGATRLLTDGMSDEDHQRNRRVEFVVIARDGYEHAPLPPAPQVPAPGAATGPAPAPAKPVQEAK